METTIHILKYGGDYVVRPGAPAVAAGSQLRFVNLTDDYVVVSFPHEEFGDASIRIDRQAEAFIHVPPLRGADLEAQAKIRRKAKAFPYSAYSAEAGDFCKGGSVPIIIVEG